MNRRDKRKAEAVARKKLSRDATNEEIFPGQHGPAQEKAIEMMKGVLDVMREHMGPNYGFTIFINERELPAGENRLPRFNYASTEARPDMIAVLRAFVQKHEEEGSKLDKINEEPQTGSKN